jgi:CHRD domain
MRKIAMFAIAGIAATAVVAAAEPALAQVPQKQVTLVGSQEVPGPGDANGRGQFTWSLDGTTLCYLLSAKRIGTPFAAHIHKGKRGVSGPVVVTLLTPKPASATCTTVSSGVADSLRVHPARWYVNVHSTALPAGAIRAQLG